LKVGALVELSGGGCYVGADLSVPACVWNEGVGFFYAWSGGVVLVVGSVGHSSPHLGYDADEDGHYEAE